MFSPPRAAIVEPDGDWLNQALGSRALNTTSEPSWRVDGYVAYDSVGPARPSAASTRTHGAVIRLASLTLLPTQRRGPTAPRDARCSSGCGRRLNTDPPAPVEN